MNDSHITGAKLIQMGYKPSNWFKQVILHARENNLNDSEIRDYISKNFPEKEILFPHQNPIPYKKNIRAYNEGDQVNISKVFAAMDSVMKVPTVVDGAIMPDACPTGENQIPVGGVVVTKNAIHPGMHSADICCSVMATYFVNADPKVVLDAAHSITHFGPGGRKEYCDLPKELEERILSNKFLKGEKSLHLAKSHLGTQGDGNHFLFVGKSKETGLTVMVTHHGSRGFGANLYKEGMKVAQRYTKEISPDTDPKNSWIPFDTEDGKEYWEALQIVREWTKLNHTIIHDETMKLAGTTYEMENGHESGRFWNEHNFVFKVKDLFYHAKGATPLDYKFVPDNQRSLRLIPLNMSQPVLVVSGYTTENNLGFAPHGAGRNVSRTEHKKSKGGKSDLEVFQEETKGLDVRFFSGVLDISELPSAYKDAEMIKSQIEEFNLGSIIDEIIPYGCIMAGGFVRRN